MLKKQLLGVGISIILLFISVMALHASEAIKCAESGQACTVGICSKAAYGIDCEIHYCETPGGTITLSCKAAPF